MRRVRLMLFLCMFFSIFVLPAWIWKSPAKTLKSPEHISAAFRQSKPMKLALGACQSQCFEGEVEYNPSTLKVTRIDRFDASQRAWVSAAGSSGVNPQDTAFAALKQVTQNMALPGTCPEEGCSCRLTSPKPPFSAWQTITVSSDFVVKHSGQTLDYRAHGTVDYRSRVTQGQCDLSTIQQSSLP